MGLACPSPVKWRGKKMKDVEGRSPELCLEEVLALTLSSVCFLISWRTWQGF